MDFKAISLTVMVILQWFILSLDGCQFQPVGEYMRFVRVPENQKIGDGVLYVNVSPKKNLSIQSIDNKGDIDYFRIKDINETSVSIVLSRSLEELVDSDSPQNILKFRLLCHWNDNDDTNSSYLTVTVYVEDINDHSPIFIDAPYRVTVDESVPIGLTIFRGIHAFDRDKPNSPNSDVQYNIVAGNDKGKFALNSNYRPYVVTKKLLDYDTGDRQFNLTISASDRGVPPKVTNCTLFVIVQDNDDLNPTFTKGVYRTKIDEFYPFTNEKIFQKLNFDPEIFAFDQDTGIDTTVRYDIIAGNERQLFDLNSRNGSLFLQRQIDLDQEHSIPGNTFVLQIQVSQVDNKLKTALARVEVEVLDLNDNRPEFETDFYNISIVENLPNGFSILRVVANDADQGENAEFSYSLKDGEDVPFELDSKTGWISVSDQNRLDRESRSSFRMKVFAIEKLPSILSDSEASFTTVQITLLDANDNNPKFVPTNLYEFSVSSDIEIGHFIGTVKAVDPDFSHNGVVKFTIQKTSSQNTTCPFRIDTNSGKIFVRDSPLAEGKHGFFVEASDQSLNPSERRYSLAVVTIEVIKSESDGSARPDFIGAPYEFWVANDAEVGSTVGQIRVRNVADEKLLEFDLLHSYHEGVPFAIEEKSGAISIVDDIKRFQRSDFEFETVVLDSNNDLSLTSNVSIHVLDPNAPNNFIKDQPSPIEYHVKENISGALIGQLFYKNLTKLLQNKSVKFRIANQKDTNGKILISQDGTLYTHEALDREETDVYRLTIIAEYHQGLIGGTAIYQVVIYVDDENDNAPIFEHDLYEGKIKENCISGTEVDLNFPIRAVDLDSGINGQFTYTLFGEGSKMFRINKKSGKVYFISGSSPLDRESKAVYYFRLTATDKGGLSSQVKLVIKILDENDNAPAFKRIILFTNNRMEILSFSKGTNSKIELSQEWNNSISLIPETRGVQHRYFILHLSLPEDTEVGKPLMRLQAEDLDEAENVHLQYILISENYMQKKSQNNAISSRKESQPHFIIHPINGDVSLTQFLTSQSQLILNFTSRDSKFYSDFLRIKISVKDINDHPPIFKMNWYAFDVFENVPINTTVGVLEAVDNEDIGDNSRITYDFVFNHLFDHLFPFSISPQNGVIKVKRNLNREILDTYSFQVIAFDNPVKIEDRLNSTVNVQINILDVNDNAPQFYGYDEIVFENDRIPVYYVNLAENCPIGTFVIKLEANDSDLPDNGNGLFLFELSNNQTNPKDKTLFSIDSKEGLITTIDRLDFDINPIHNLTVTVTDFGSPRLSSVALVSINIVDVHDDLGSDDVIEKNLFTHRLYAIDIDENIPVPVKIVTLNVSDEYRNHLLKFSLISEKNGHLKSFKIDPSNGTIFMMKSPDFEHVRYYELKASVNKFKSARGLPVLIYPSNRESFYDLAHNEAKIIINVKDVNDNPPKFPSNGKPLITAVPASVAYGHSILVLKATDADSEINSKIYYQILNRGDDHSRFMIDHETGEVRTSSSFLNDAGKVFGFDVKATDTNGADNGKSTIANVFVYVLNDEKQLSIEFRKKPFDLEKFLTNITTKLNEITGYDMRIQRIEPRYENNFIEEDIQLREKKSTLRQELISYDFNDIRYGALGNKQKGASLFFLFSLEFLILISGALLIIGIIMAVYCFSYIKGIQKKKRTVFFQSNVANCPVQSSSFGNFKNLSLKYSNNKINEIDSRRSSELSHVYKEEHRHQHNKRSSCLKKIDESDGFLETSAISLHSSGKDSGIVDNNCSTPEKCYCRLCTSNSSDEFSNYEDSLKSECKIHGKQSNLDVKNRQRVPQSNYKINTNGTTSVIKFNGNQPRLYRYSSKY